MTRKRTRKRTRKQGADDLLKAVDGMLLVHQGQIKPARVTVLEPTNPRDVRQKLNVSRPKFAAMIGVSQRTVENWEQGRNKPTGATRALLRVAAHNPQAVLEALR
jgi:putative transcriptional regulator